MLARFGAGGSFDSITRQDVSKIAQDLQLLLESHHSYPALGYFRWQESYYRLEDEGIETALDRELGADMFDIC